MYANLKEGQVQDDPSGFDNAFNLLHEVQDQVASGIFISNVFFYTNPTGKLNYTVLGKIFTFCHIDKKK